MVITVLKSEEMIAAVRKRLGLPEDGGLDDSLLAAMIRRSAASLCPCSRASIRTSVWEGLKGLADIAELEARINSAVEAALVVGDLLELSDVTTVLEGAKGTWVFLAPPSFVERPGGRVFILGVTRDQDEFLPGTLASRVQYVGASRFIVSEELEGLPSELRELGLHEMSSDAWLKAPKLQSADNVVAGTKNRLANQGPLGSLSDVLLLDPSSSVTYYRGRWTPLNSQSGMFVVRHPQEFGAPMWGFADIENGQVLRFLQLPLPQSKWRGCDDAWHLQMAIDRARGEPQIYRRTSHPKGTRFDFFSPLPLWAHRRLTVVGHPQEPNRSLLSYLLPDREARAEEEFFQERLFMSEESNYC